MPSGSTTASARKLSTGAGDVRTTLSATEPRRKWDRPRRPCVPMTISSQPKLEAVSTITSSGSIPRTKWGVTDGSWFPGLFSRSSRRASSPVTNSRSS